VSTSAGYRRRTGDQGGLHRRREPRSADRRPRRISAGETAERRRRADPTASPRAPHARAPSPLLSARARADHLTPVELDRRHPLFVGDLSEGVGQVEPAQPEQPDGGRPAWSRRLRRSDIEGSVVISGGNLSWSDWPTRARALSPHQLRPVRPLDVHRFLISLGHESPASACRSVTAGPERLEGRRYSSTRGVNRLGCPATTAEHQGQAVARRPDHRPWAAPDADPVGRCPSGRGGLTYWVVSGERTVPDHVTGWSRSRREQVELLLEERLVVGEIESEEREGLGQRAAANDELSRPFDTASSVANSAYNRTGSCVLSTVTAGASRSVRSAAIAARSRDRRVHEFGSVVLADVERVDPTASARTASSTVLRMTTSGQRLTDSSTVTYAGVSNPNSNSNHVRPGVT